MAATSGTGSVPAPSAMQQTEDVSIAQRMVSATIGSFLTNILVTPLDVVRVRLQSQSLVKNTSPFNSHTLQTLKNAPPNLGVTACCREVFWIGQNSQICMVGPEAGALGATSVADCAVEETQRKTFTSTLDGLRKIARNEGVLTLWRGLSPTLMMSIPGNIIYFAGYDWLRTDDRSLIKRWFPDAYAPFVAGSVARTTAASLISPIEMFRTRLQATPGTGAGHFKATLEGLYHMAQTQGYSSLWRGLTLTMWRDVPFSGLYWWCYEEVKKYLVETRKRSYLHGLPHGSSASQHHLHDLDTPTFFDSFFAGASSGSLAAFVTTPFDVGKTRQQVFRHMGDVPGSAGNVPGGVLHPEQLPLPKFLLHIFREEGMAGLFRGCVARCLKVAPACAIMISTKDLPSKAERIFEDSHLPGGGSRECQMMRLVYLLSQSSALLTFASSHFVQTRCLNPLSTGANVKMAPDNALNGEQPPRVESAVDIVAVPAIGADPGRTWLDEYSQTPWLLTELTRCIPTARVLFADHGHLDSRDDLDSLAHRLLKWLLEERRATSLRRPIFFICHSTGGLVAKAALVIASQLTSRLGSILSSCYGIAFLATPHHGSTYLSAPEFTKSVQRLMRLKHRIPPRIQELFKPRHSYLLRLSSEFKAISADIKLWTYLETVDSTLSIADSEAGTTIDMHVPITSIRSGILGFEHEKETPLATDHVGTAAFKGQELTTRISFIDELHESVTVAIHLSKLTDAPLDVDLEVMVQVNGFFEDTARGISDETPLTLWSTKASLREYLANGPSSCLNLRLQRTAGIPASIYDDSSISSFDSRPTSAQVRASMDGILHPRDASVTDANRPENVPQRPSIKKSRSFLGHISPQIHITEPAVHDYFDVQPELSQGVKISDSQPQDKTGDATQSETGVGNVTATSSPPRYKSFLPIPPPSRDTVDQQRAEMPRKMPRFDQPEPGSEKLLWIHVPYTHTGWVPAILTKACGDHDRQRFVEEFINDEYWYSNLIRARHLEPHARYLYTYHSFIGIPTGILPVPDDISQASLESKLIWRYLGSEPPIHIRRTLDQFGYPNLRSTVARDDDQMLWKRTKKVVNLNDEIRIPAEADDITNTKNTFMDGKVLMVDQLWLWIVDEKTVVTFFPNQEATTAEGKLYEQSNLYSSIYNELNGDLARRFETAGDLASLIVLHAVTVLLDRTLHRDLQILRIFEESISILTEIVTKSFKRFRNRGFNTRPADYNKNAEGRPMSAAERDERDNKVARRNREDLSTLLELRDIVDELSTLLKLLEQQSNTVRTMSSYFEHKGCGQAFIESALSRLEEYRNQVLEMRENASVAQKAVENLLDLKQKQASVDESRLARWEAEVTQDQSRSVMVFTIFTIIFLPLSFFTSLFGINAREWSGEQDNLTLGQMLYISGPASFAIIMFALLIAFNERLRETLWRAQKLVLNIVADFLLAPVTLLFQWRRKVKTASGSGTKRPEPESGSMQPKKGRRGLGKYRRNNKIQRQQSGEDIWSEHEDKMMGGAGGVGRPVLVDGEVERERTDPYAEKGREWGVG
ncbi:hypothetical protein CBS13152_4507 [Aspergillus niger]|nr:hypothetical protein CBS13152_4507 [Aspergillus niger]